MIRAVTSLRARSPVLVNVAILLIVGCLGMALGYAVQRARTAEAGKTATVLAAEGRAQRLAQFNALDTGPAVAMLGDSLTSQGEWSELLGQVTANRGIPGDTAAAVLTRVSGVPASASTTFVMIGVNDLAGGAAPAEVAQTTRMIVAALAPRRVVVQSILFTSDPEMNGTIAALNALNRAHCGTGACLYLELNDLFVADGVLRQDMTVDGVHLAGKAYPLWAQRVLAVVP